MKSLWNLKVFIASAVLICGIAFASAILLKRARERNLVDYAKTVRVEAELGHASAEAELGHLYYHGLGVPLDYSEAASWFRKAADKGDPRGQYDLAYMYRSGQGVSKDLAEAARWARMAADQGNSRAEFAIGSSYYYGQGVPQDSAIAASWYRKAADHGDAEAQYDLGYMLYYGQGVAQDRTEANRLFHQAADQGNENARRTLGIRRVRFGIWSKIIITLSFLSSGLLLYGALVNERRGQNKKWKTTALTGIFMLIYGAFHLFADLYRGNLPTSSVDTTLLFARDLFGGACIVMLLIVVLSAKPKTGLVISCGMFAAYNLSMLAAYGLLHRAPTIRVFLLGIAWFVGSGVTSAIFLRLEHQGSGDNQNDGPQNEPIDLLQS